jgi:hypothetical protein
LVCRTISLAAKQHLLRCNELPSDEEVLSWLDLVRDRIWSAASLRAKTARDFAATVIMVISDGSQTLVAQIGDGCAALRKTGGPEWSVPLWPDHGEYASTTYFVTDEPQVKCRFVREQSNLAAIAVLTDGLERLALDFAAMQPAAGFFEGVERPVAASATQGKDAPLSVMLKTYLEGDNVCARTDDDKTLVVATRR